MKLDNFINMMTGHFNNKEQFDNMQREGKHILMQNTLIQSVMRKFQTFLKILMVNLLLKKATMRQMVNAMLPHIFSLLQRKKTELCCILMKYQKEKIKVRFHMIL